MSAAIHFVSHAGHRIACLAHPHPRPTRLPVVWVHGLTASVRFWEAAMYREVREQRSWYSISLPFHHPSTYAGPYTAESLDEQLLAELLAHPIEQLVPGGSFHLVGYSLGAFACMNYAAKFPGRVASIISIGGFLRGRARGLEGVLQFFAQGHLVRRALFHGSWWIMQQHVGLLKLATLFYARRWRSMLRYPLLDPTLRTIFPDVRRHAIAGQQALFRYLLDMDLLDEVDRIRVPVLIIAGDRDPIIPYAHQVECAALLPNARLLSLPGVGHVAFAEAAERFHPAVVNWLAEHD